MIIRVYLRSFADKLFFLGSQVRGGGPAWFAVIWIGTLLAASARADCGGEFRDWLDGVRGQAQEAGYGHRALTLIDAVRWNGKVLARDRSQRVFAQDWQTFAARMINAHRLQAGRARLVRLAPHFARAQHAFGVPGPVVAAFWGLETDYGAVQGDFATLDALATLAHDCRRPELFRPQLLAALRLVDRGYLKGTELTGAWAGELGQFQLLPADYLEFGSDGDGDGRVNLKTSAPDGILTAARFLQHLGWRAGEPWLLQVGLPAELPWAQAGSADRLPIAQWTAWGLRTAAGEPLPDDAPPASLLLPMGHKGPAFLAFPNFDCFLAWNQSMVYATTAAYFATRLAGAPAVASGHPDPGLSCEQVKQLQGRLRALGYDVGPADGVLGAKTRDAVRQEQLGHGLPADAWPTPELLSLL